VEKGKRWLSGAKTLGVKRPKGNGQLQNKKQAAAQKKEAAGGSSGWRGGKRSSASRGTKNHCDQYTGGGVKTREGSRPTKQISSIT